MYAAQFFIIFLNTLVTFENKKIYKGAIYTDDYCIKITVFASTPMHTKFLLQLCICHFKYLSSLKSGGI